MITSDIRSFSISVFQSFSMECTKWLVTHLHITNKQCRDTDAVTDLTSLKILRLRDLLNFSYLWFPYLSLPFVTFRYLLTFPYLSLTFLTCPYLSLLFLTIFCICWLTDWLTNERTLRLMGLLSQPKITRRLVNHISQSSLMLLIQSQSMMSLCR